MARRELRASLWATLLAVVLGLGPANRVSTGGVFIPDSGIGSPIVASCIADVWYRTGTSAPAPTMVQFDCSATEHNDPGIRSKADLLYSFSYGDASCPDWTTGFGQFDCDSDKWHNPIAAHLYRSGGTYNWTVTVTDPNGATDTESGSITIHEPTDSTHGWAVADRRCICYDAGGAGCQTNGVAGFAGSPCDLDADGDCTGTGETAANCTETNDLDAAIDNTDDRWWSIRCGDAYTSSATWSTGATYTEGRKISGYGTCTLSNGINVTMSPTHNLFEQDASGPISNIRISNLNVTNTTGTTGGGTVSCQQTSSDCKNILIYDSKFTNTRTFFFSGDSLDINERIALVSNEFDPTVVGDNSAGFFTITHAKRLVWLGNDFSFTASGGCGSTCSNGLRVSAPWYFIAAHNSFQWLTTGGDSPWGTFQLRGGNGDINTELTVVARNRVWDDSDENNRLFTNCTSQACGTGDSPNLHQFLLYEGNYLGSGSSNSRHWQPFIVNNQDVTIINNVIDARGVLTANSNTTVVATNSNDFAPERLVVLNNTILDDFAQGASVIDICADATSTGRCRNNVVWSENKTSGTNLTRSYNGTASNNVALYGSSGNPFYGTDDAGTLTGACDNGQTAQAFTCFKQRTSGGGIASVRGTGFDFPGAEDFFVGQDFESQARPANSDGWDIGADEYTP